MNPQPRTDDALPPDAACPLFYRKPVAALRRNEQQRAYYQRTRPARLAHQIEYNRAHPLTPEQKAARAAYGRTWYRQNRERLKAQRAAAKKLWSPEKRAARQEYMRQLDGKNREHKNELRRQRTARRRWVAALH